jgi:iron(III) transport system permease protein
MEKRLTLAVAALTVAAIGLLPVLTMIANSFYVHGKFSLTAYETLLGSGEDLMLLVGHSIFLSMFVTFFAVVLGVPLGVLLGRTDLPLRHAFTILLTLPLLVPPYVIAVAWFNVLGPRGWIGRLLLPGTSEYLSSTLFGFYGCIGTLSTAFMPVVMLLTIAYVGTVNPRLEHAGLLVSRWPNVLWRITLPLIAPAILFAAIVVFLLTLGEVGVPTFLRYPVYPLEVLTHFAAFYDFSAATVAAIPLLIITAAILALEMRFLHTSVLELSAADLGRRGARIALGRWRAPLFGAVLAGSLVTVVLPISVLIVQAASPNAFAVAYSRASDSIFRSIVFGAIGATLLTILGFFCGYLVQTRALPGWRSVDALALFLFTVPGTVIGIGLISLWNSPMTNVIYSTPAIIILGYLAQYALLPTRMMAASLQRIPPSLERAAQLCGAGWFITLRDIVAPNTKRGLVATWLIAYVFCVRDLGITIAVYPPGSDTLPVRTLTLMANGAPSLIAALCVILIAVTLLPLLLAALGKLTLGDRHEHDRVSIGI